jgi:hypothetical protein
VKVMNTQTITVKKLATAEGYDPQRPYRDYPVVDLIEWLEVQHSRGEYNPDLVWELATRACELEELQRRSAPPT